MALPSFVSLKTSLLDLIFPPACVGCGRAGAFLCDGCAQRVTPQPSPICSRCGQAQESATLCARCAADPANPIIAARACAVFDTPMREAIHALKYEGRSELAPLLARYLSAGYATAMPASARRAIGVVAPVPLHANRIAQRGYNQSALLAEHFCAANALNLDMTLLERIRDTPPQVGKNAAERQTNVADSFRATPGVAGQTILLVDDVYTTGATLRACAQAARDAGALGVYALTLARPLLQE